jgi:hypothetical protein
MQTTAVERVCTALDRCDSCNAAAKVIVTFINGELMFCGHHAKEMSIALVNKSISIYDPDNYI